MPYFIIPLSLVANIREAIVKRGQRILEMAELPFNKNTYGI